MHIWLISCQHTWNAPSQKEVLYQATRKLRTTSAWLTLRSGEAFQPVQAHTQLTPLSLHLTQTWMTLMTRSRVMNLFARCPCLRPPLAPFIQMPLISPHRLLYPWKTPQSQQFPECLHLLFFCHLLLFPQSQSWGELEGLLLGHPPANFTSSTHPPFHPQVMMMLYILMMHPSTSPDKAMTNSISVLFNGNFCGGRFLLSPEIPRIYILMSLIKTI